MCTIAVLIVSLPPDEVDPYKKPQELLELSPKGLVPALRLNNFDPPKALNESTIILEYLEESVSAVLFDAHSHRLPASLPHLVDGPFFPLGPIHVGVPLFLVMTHSHQFSQMLAP